MKSITRRDFLKAMAIAGVAGVAGCTTGKSLDALAPSRGGLARRVLGRTGEKVTILGLGCAYAAGNADEAQTRATIEAALEGGVRYFDIFSHVIHSSLHEILLKYFRIDHVYQNPVSSPLRIFFFCSLLRPAI